VLRAEEADSFGRRPSFSGATPGQQRIRQSRGRIAQVAAVQATHAEPLRHMFERIVWS
jgi:hypothetical protein